MYNDKIILSKIVNNSTVELLQKKASKQKNSGRYYWHIAPLNYYYNVESALSDLERVIRVCS